MLIVFAISILPTFVLVFGETLGRNPSSTLLVAKSSNCANKIDTIYLSQITVLELSLPESFLQRRNLDGCYSPSPGWKKNDIIILCTQQSFVLCYLFCSVTAVRVCRGSKLGGNEVYSCSPHSNVSSLRRSVEPLCKRLLCQRHHNHLP